jgi:hypothetical protein
MVPSTASLATAPRLKLSDRITCIEMPQNNQSLSPFRPSVAGLGIGSSHSGAGFPDRLPGHRLLGWLLRRIDLDPGCRSMEKISILVSGLEEDVKDLPVLLRQYLKGDATLLSFNLDTSFSNVVDALIFLDLPRTSAPMVRRVMGAKGYLQFCRFHRMSPNPPLRFRKAC